MYYQLEWCSYSVVEESSEETRLYSSVFRSPLPKIPNPPFWSTAHPFYRRNKSLSAKPHAPLEVVLCPRQQWSLWWRRCRRPTDRWLRGTHLGRLARRALAGAAWHAARLVRPLACLCSDRAGEIRFGVRPDGLPRERSNSSRWKVHPVLDHLTLANIPSRRGTIWRHML